MSEQFSHYQIIEPIGAGGMGEVYRARDTQLDRDVALKILPDAFAADPERLARFEREAKLLASLNHPNIGAIYAIAREGNRTGLALELVEGEDLAERLRRGPVALDDALDIATQIATALEAAHEQGIVHRDLKPANVKITPDGVVKVLDFGLAKALEPDMDGVSDPSISQSPTMLGATTQGGVILGTAAYMSPEQARGKKLDRRTDIFAFGALIYELLTGLRAFDGETVSDTLASILKEEPDRDALPTDLPSAIRLLLDRCLKKDARQRLRDMGEARLILEAVKSGDAGASTILGAAPAGDVGATTARPPGVGPREFVAWGLVIIMAAAAAFMALRRDDSAPVSRVSINRLSIPISGDVNLRYSHGGLVISPDGTRVAYINNKQLYVRQLDSWEPIEVPQSSGCATPFWSPDSKWLAYNIEKELWKTRPDGTQRTLIATSEVGFSRPSGGAWLSDDRIVYRGDTDLMVVPASGGEPVTFFSEEGDTAIVDFHDPSALPGGDGIVTIVHTQSGVNTLALVTRQAELTSLITIPAGDLATPCYASSGHVLVINGVDLWAVPVSLEKREVTGEPFSVARGVAAPSVADNGTLVYVRGAGKIMRQLVLVDRAGAVVTRLGAPMDLWASYALSPDGTRAVGMESNSTDMWLHDSRNAVTRVTFTGIEHDMPSFSPDGTMMYFATGTEESYSIGRKATDRNEPEEILVPAGEMGPHYYAANPVVTSDGEILFYTTKGTNKKQDIAWLNLLSKSKPERFIQGAAREYAAMPSPANREYVAYVSDESGSDQVYLTTWPQADRKFPVSIDGGNWPHWKGDGTELYFAHGNEIYAVDVSYEPLSLGQPRSLFSRPEYDDRQPYGWPSVFDATRDGQRFLTTELADDESLDPRIAVVENWAAELEQ